MAKLKQKKTVFFNFINSLNFFGYNGGVILARVEISNLWTAGKRNFACRDKFYSALIAKLKISRLWTGITTFRIRKIGLGGRSIVAV